MVPARKKGSLTSPVNAVRQPSAIAQINRNGSSTSGSPSASVFCDQFKNCPAKERFWQRDQFPRRPDHHRTGVPPAAITHLRRWK